MSIEAFEAILGRMLGPRPTGTGVPVFDPEPWLRLADGASSAAGLQPAEVAADPATSATAALTAAFLAALRGAAHPSSARAITVLADPPGAAPVGLAALYRRALGLIRVEVEAAAADPDFAARLTAVAERLDASARAATASSEPAVEAADVTETLWSIFFPEGVGIRGHEPERVASLRAARTVTLSSLAPAPIVDPARQLLLTSNVLLTLPAASPAMTTLAYPADVLQDLERAATEPQLHWYDHPIQIGVEPAGNELLYGLRALDDAVEVEQARDPSVGTLTCILSVSVTHRGLHRVARRYVAAELAAAEPLRNLDVLVFTEDDTDRLVDEVLAPAAARFLETGPGPRLGPSTGPDPASAWAARLREVFGVDGAYGRHYSFLKAVAALWQALVSPDVRATFKIDLDQVFPQDVLVAETGRTAFELLSTPLWGARGLDARGRPVELGMIAGALVNERDIGRGLFTPDVAYPGGPLVADQHVFFSALPQALSTRAEMMERYDGPERDGTRMCLERIHVTGGTNGILIDALRRHRPFTPTFVGRAEDQAYLLSVLGPAVDGIGEATEVQATPTHPRLAYAHAAGLIMRHDKEAFAGEAIAAAEAGKIVGDDVRILQFSSYARAISGTDVEAGPATSAARDVTDLKSILDPFTGSFVSRMPVTVVMLRFALRVARALEDGRTSFGVEVASVGARRIDEALTFTLGGALATAIARERIAWHGFYDTVGALEDALRAGDAAALDLQARAVAIIDAARVGAPSGARIGPGTPPPD